MTINGKEAMCIRLHCSNREICPGFIEKDVLLYLLETDELYIWGVCGECGVSGNLTVSLSTLLFQCPSNLMVM